MAGASSRPSGVAAGGARPTRGSRLAWVMAVAAAAVVAVGVWGFARYNRSAPMPEDLYRTLQLFVLESGNLEGALPWQLEAARLLAPALAASSAALAVVLASRSRIDRQRARRRVGHVVVCGLGDRGTAAALTLHGAGHDVVGVDLDEDGPGCARCRATGIPVVVGDASDPEVLRSAGVAQAAHLVVLTSRLTAEGQVALAAAELVSGRLGPPLVIHLEIADAHLAALLRATELTEHRDHGWRLEELDLVGLGARAVLDLYPGWVVGATAGHVAVVGEGALAHRLIDELRLRWCQVAASDALVVSELDPSAALPGSDDRWAELAGFDPEVTTVYVAVEDEPAALVVALAALRWLPRAQVVVHLERACAIAELLGRDTTRLHGVSLRTAVLTPSALLDSTVERVARAMHDTYRRRAPDPSDPSAVPWDVLAADLQASNRAQAAHLAEKLRVVGCTLVPAGDGPPDVLTSDEVEVLAELEHERWVAERRAAGWVLGARDPTRRSTPYLVAWTDLDDTVRDADRAFIAVVADVVADAGLQLRRIRRSPVEVGR